MRKKFVVDLTGNKYGKLTVVSYSHTKNSLAFWNCVCDCGNKHLARGYTLKNGYTKQCRKCSKKSGSITQRKGTKDIAGELIAFIKASARRRGHEYNISAEYLQSLLESQNHKCNLTGVELFAGHLEKHEFDSKKWNASLDRIDSTKGYIEGNVQWVTKTINWMKQDYTQEEFIEQCKLVVNTYEQ